MFMINQKVKNKMHVYRKVLFKKKKPAKVLCRKKNKNRCDLCRKVSFMSRCNMPSKFSGENTENLLSSVGVSAEVLKGKQ